MEQPAALPRPEYPRPQFVRPRWLCLNGVWQFEIDAGDSGLERGLCERALLGRIVVPFCPESRLSGVEHTDFMQAVWYRREVTIPADWAGGRVLLHIQACDYDTTVWVNGVEVGRHRGGFTPIECDLHSVVSAGETATIVIRARDDGRAPQPRGKQSMRYENHGCRYTRTTGIWQTVWVEPVPDVHLRRTRITPDAASGVIRIVQPLSGNRVGWRLRAVLSDGGGVVARAETAADMDLSPALDLLVPCDRRRMWSPDDPHLYALRIELVDAAGAVVDALASYAALRSIAIDAQAVKLNGKALFQRLVLDQGYYPDGIMTAPSDEALQRDIALSQQAGFNGARLHQKVFEERFLYHADRMGYLCWGEFGDWGIDQSGDTTEAYSASVITQWIEAVQRDYSHPCIVGWCGGNEQMHANSDRIGPHHDVIRGLFLAAKAIDPSRPVLDVSGYSHRVAESDVYDAHDYEQDPAKFAAHHAGLAEGKPFVNRRQQADVSIAYRGQPYFVSEFGGAWWNPSARPGEASWGYGDRPKTIEEFYERFAALCSMLLGNRHMFGYCYTQLTDVFQEQNGIYQFDRSAKFDGGRLRAVQSRAAAIERG